MTPNLLPLKGFNSIWILFSIFILTTSLPGFGQDVEIDGKIRILTIDSISNSSTMIMKDIDGTLASSNFGTMLIKHLISMPHGIQFLLSIGEDPVNLLNGGANIEDFYGLKHEGGIIFLLRPDGSGMVAADSDQSAIAEWGCFGTDLPIPNAVFITEAGALIGDGLSNTEAIDSASCTNLDDAAKICSSLKVEGFDDWYLPSASELKEMYLKLRGTSEDTFENSFYWSSTEISSQTAFAIHFNAGLEYSVTKYEVARVRAIRSF